MSKQKVQHKNCEGYNVRYKRFSSGTVSAMMYDNNIILQPGKIEDKEFDTPNKVEQFRVKGQRKTYKHKSRVKVGEFRPELMESVVKEVKEVDPKKQRDNIRRAVRRSKQSLYDYTKSNTWTHFWTLTFDPDKVDRYDYKLVLSKVQNYMKNLRRKAPNMQYLLVPEPHNGKRSECGCGDCGVKYTKGYKCPECGSDAKVFAWHFHALVNGVEELDFKQSVNKHGEQMYSHGTYLTPITDVPGFKWGFNSSTKIVSSERAAHYIGKYITKDLAYYQKGKRKYYPSQGLNLPKVDTQLETDGEYQKLKDVTDEVYNANSDKIYKKEVSVVVPVGDNMVEVQKLTIYEGPEELLAFIKLNSISKINKRATPNPNNMLYCKGN